MPYVETLEELVDTIADWCGAYGACHETTDKPCAFDRAKNPMCCRQGFSIDMQERIREAIKNDATLSQ